MIIKYPIGKTEKHYVLPDGVTEIDAQAFRSTRLDTIEMPDSLTKIDLYAFFDSYIVNIVFHGTKFEWDAIDKVENWDNTVNDYTIIYQGEELTGSEGLAYTLSDDGESYIVSGIGTCTDTDIVIPAIYSGKKVTSIGMEAFFYCQQITSVSIPDTVLTIGSAAFAGTPIVSIKIPNSVIYIANDAFFGCAFESIVIPESVVEIGPSAFGYCYNLNNFIVDENNRIYQSIDGNLYTRDDQYDWEYTMVQYAIAKDDTSYNILDGVTHISKRAFAFNPYLMNIYIPSSVENIGAEAFWGCKSLEQIIFAGTQAEWDAIEKGENWDNGTANYIIYCIDGNITK
jgi:hypothetical protein